jgi:hypothetical protein
MLRDFCGVTKHNVFMPIVLIVPIQENNNKSKNNNIIVAKTNICNSTWILGGLECNLG